MKPAKPEFSMCVEAIIATHDLTCQYAPSVRSGAKANGRFSRASFMVGLLLSSIGSNFSNLVAARYFLALAMMPVAIRLAALKCQLWVIDALINRTLVYGSPSITLTAVYMAGVVSVQAVLGLIPGQSSPIATVMTTVAVMTIVCALRSHLQTGIDKRSRRT